MTQNICKSSSRLIMEKNSVYMSESFKAIRHLNELEILFTIPSYRVTQDETWILNVLYFLKATRKKRRSSRQRVMFR